MALFHTHRYGDVKNGFQYCQVCGKAIAAPTIECSHIMQKLHVTDIRDEHNRYTGYLIIKECTKCGDVKEYRVKI